jgi:hypothetical protein
MWPAEPKELLTPALNGISTTSKEWTYPDMFIFKGIWDCREWVQNLFFALMTFKFLSGIELMVKRQ